MSPVNLTKAPRKGANSVSGKGVGGGHEPQSTGQEEQSSPLLQIPSPQ